MDMLLFPRNFQSYQGLMFLSCSFAALYRRALVSSKTKSSRKVYTLHLEREALLSSSGSELSWKVCKCPEQILVLFLGICYLWILRFFIFYFFNITKEAKLTCTYRCWISIQTTGGMRDPSEDELSKSPHGSFTKVDFGICLLYYYYQYLATEFFLLFIFGLGGCSLWYHTHEKIFLLSLYYSWLSDYLSFDKIFDVSEVCLSLRMLDKGCTFHLIGLEYISFDFWLQLELEVNPFWFCPTPLTFWAKSTFNHIVWKWTLKVERWNIRLVSYHSLSMRHASISQVVI